MRYLTFLYTCPLTVLHGMEVAGLQGGNKSVKDAESLTIHLVRNLPTTLKYRGSQTFLVRGALKILYCSTKYKKN